MSLTLHYTLIHIQIVCQQMHMYSYPRQSRQ